MEHPQKVNLVLAKNQQKLYFFWHPGKSGSSKRLETKLILTYNTAGPGVSSASLGPYYMYLLHPCALQPLKILPIALSHELCGETDE